MDNKISIFEKIIRKLLPASIIFENEYLIVIEDINPQAKIHYLIIPKEKFQDINNIPIEKMYILEKMFLMIQYISQNVEGASEYKIVINNGASAGQCIFYLHIHFLSGY